MPIINQIVQGGGSPTPTPALYREYEIVNSNKIQKTNPSSTMSFNGVTTVSESYALAYLYYGATNITSVNMHDLKQIGNAVGVRCCESMFQGCTGITTLDLSSLEQIYAEFGCSYMFAGCSSITSINLENLYSIGTANGNGASYMFSSCSALASVNLSSLRDITASGCIHLFDGCVALTTATLHSLKNINTTACCQYMFANSGVTSLYFPAINPNSFGSSKNQFRYMCNGVSNVTIHFPSNVQTQVAALTGYSTTAPFGAAAGTILFDLPATVVLTGANSTEYERSPKYDTVTALAWRVDGTEPNTTTYYTSGTTDPVVNDTIYSDSACTVAVTTISSIA